ncbi:MAG: alpha/beta fold hydrolase [Haloechinothrix sp.]
MNIPMIAQDTMTRGEVSGTLDRADGTLLRWWRGGRGEPVVLVHGSFDDHHSWSGVVAQLAEYHDVITYDRRGHSTSTAPRSQGSIAQDADDLLSIVDNVIGGPAHLVGLSYGASVAMLAAVQRREAVLSVAVHEPPLFGLLARNPVAKVLGAEAAVWTGHAAELIRNGNLADGVRIFAEKVGFGKGSWHGLFTREQRATMISNAHTWLDQYNDPGRLAVDITTLAWARFPITLFVGERTHELYKLVAEELADRLPFMRTVRIPGAGHAPHLTHASGFADALLGHLRSR